MSRIHLDTSNWPLVVTTIEGDIDDAVLVAYFDEFLTRVIDKGTLFASIVDATKLSSAPSARQRALIAEWETKHGTRGERVNVGIAIVTTSSVVRGAMTAVNWISPPRVPTTYEATLPAAITWAKARLHDRGVTVKRESTGIDDIPTVR